MVIHTNNCSLEEKVHLEEMSTYFWITTVCQLLFQVKTIHHEKKWLVQTVTQSHKCFILRKTYYFGIMQSALCVLPISSHRPYKEVMFKGQDSKNNFTASTRIFFCKDGINHRCAKGRPHCLPVHLGPLPQLQHGTALLSFTASVPLAQVS